MCCVFRTHLCGVVPDVVPCSHVRYWLCPLWKALLVVASTCEPKGSQSFGRLIIWTLPDNVCSCPEVTPDCCCGAGSPWHARQKNAASEMNRVSVQRQAALRFLAFQVTCWTSQRRVHGAVCLFVAKTCFCKLVCGPGSFGRLKQLRGPPSSPTWSRSRWVKANRMESCFGSLQGNLSNAVRGKWGVGIFLGCPSYPGPNSVSIVEKASFVFSSSRTCLYRWYLTLHASKTHTWK